MNSAAFVESDEYYDEIHAAILETPRGRWFLREFAKRNQSCDTERLMAAIGELRRSLTADMSGTHIEILRRELQEMSHSIVQTRQEIAAIKPMDANNNRIMVATEELDAIVTATERATSDILTAAERLQAVADSLEMTGADQRLCDEVADLATSILMACSFQDITGQRTTKVIHVLRYLEQRVNAMIDIWGVDGVTPVPGKIDSRPGAHLLNGPARAGEGIAQDDVDRLMSGTPVKASAPPMHVEPAASDEIDQSDIDRLFG